MSWSWNPLRLLGGQVMRPVRAWLGRHPWARWLLYALPVLLVLSLLNPVVTLLASLLGFLARVFEPLLQSAAGRLLLLNLVLVVMAMVGFLVVRNRLRQLLGDVVLRWHTLGIQCLIRGDQPAAERRFRSVVRLAAWLDVRRAAAAYPAVADDARLKLARVRLSQERPERALAELSYVREQGLPRELKASLRELRARAMLALPGALPENVETGLREAIAARPRHSGLLGLLRDHLVARGALAEAIEIQDRLLAATPAPGKDEERVRLARLWVARAEQERSLHNRLDRARDHARRALKIEPGFEPALLLLGDLALAAQDPDSALRAWGQAATPAALVRAEAMLRRSPDVMPPREVLVRFPTRGMLAVVARIYAARGEERKATNALRQAAAAGSPAPLFAALLAERLEAAGDLDQAAAAYREAILGLLGGGDRALMAPRDGG